MQPDTRPAFVLDPSKPFVIELARGSHLDGLDVVTVTEKGNVELIRFAGGQNAESASLHMSNAEVVALVDTVNNGHMTSMARAYYDPDVADGTQWTLRIEQSPSSKVIYCNNSFPNEITAFADRLDAMLQAARSDTVAWRSLPPQESAERRRALWARIGETP